MTINIDLEEDTILHLTNDHLDSDNFIELLISKKGEPVDESVIVPVDQLYLATQAFLEQGRMNRQRHNELLPNQE